MKTKPIIGQEAICDGGLGRVTDFCLDQPMPWIQVATYVRNESFKWDADSVKLVPLPTAKSVDEVNRAELVQYLEQLIQVAKENKYKYRAQGETNLSHLHEFSENVLEKVLVFAKTH